MMMMTMISLILTLSIMKVRVIEWCLDIISTISDDDAPIEPQPVHNRVERKSGVKFSFTSVSSEEMNGSRHALSGGGSMSSSYATQVRLHIELLSSSYRLIVGYRKGGILD